MTRTDWMLFLLVALLALYGFRHFVEPWAQIQWAYLDSRNAIETTYKILEGVK